jgi:hypothetical protein
MPDAVCNRAAAPPGSLGTLGPDLGGRLAQLLVRQQRLDRFTLARLASTYVPRTHPVACL